MSGATAAPAPSPSPRPGVAATKPAAAKPAPVTPIKWTRCGGGVQCGELEVPLDYKNPGKGTTTLAVGRRPADDPKRKLGVIFVNPGGPGAAAAGSVQVFGSLLGRDIRNRFDIVAVDPRGMGGSDVVTCTLPSGAKEVVFPSVTYPVSNEEIKERRLYDKAVVDACANTNPRILKYMTTADVARDMDRVRESLGQKTLNYYGISYGSQLGVTYAAMFPGKVRTMVVDGVLDPVEWSTGREQGAGVPVTTRIRSGEGAHRAMMAAIAECERAGADCEQGETIRNDWNELTARLKKKPVEIELAPGLTIRFTYQDLIGISAAMLYSVDGIPDLIAMVSLMNQDFDNFFGAPAGTAKAPRASATTLKYYKKLLAHDRKMERNLISYDPPAPIDEPELEQTFFPGFEGVLCSETANPTHIDAWTRSARAQDKSHPGFGPMWTWTSSACAGWKWKGVNAYKGPYTSKPAGGMMVMSTLHDPATPYSGARAVRSLVGNSRLVTVPTWGHAVLDLSECAEKARNGYLISGKLPAKDMTCRPDHRLFTPLD